MAGLILGYIGVENLFYVLVSDFMNTYALMMEGEALFESLQSPTRLHIVIPQ